MTQFKRTFLLAASWIIFTSVQAYADIGKVGGIGNIGSPVVPSNMPKAPAKNNAPSNQDSDDSTDDDSKADDKKEAVKQPTLLLDIAFNQKHVNFQRMLSQAVTGNEQDSPGSTYEVVSTVPNASSNPSQAARMNNAYAENVNAVVQQIQSLGLPQNRILTRTVYKDDITDQDVGIYVSPK